MGGSGLQGGPVAEKVLEACRSAKLTEAQTLDVQSAALARLRATGNRQKALREAQKRIEALQGEEKC
jgi:hypothetical protein